MQSLPVESSIRTFAIGENLISLGILPIDSKYKIPPLEISAVEKKSRPKTKDDKSKFDREYIERTVTFKANEKKSYSGLVNQLPQPGYRKQADKCSGVLKIDGDGKVTFNFCTQKQDFKLNVNLVQSRSDIYKLQQENQLKLMDGRRKNEGQYNLYTPESAQEKEGEGQKSKQKRTKTKLVNSDEEDDPFSGNDTD